MMLELKPRQMKALLPLFSEKSTHKIAQSCCLGLVKCRAFADNAKAPTAAVIVLMRFGIGFAAGDAAHAPALLEMLRDWHPWYEISDPPADWHPALAAWSRESYAYTRYGFTNDPACFDLSILRTLGIAPEGCEIRTYDAAMARKSLKASWSEDQTGAFMTPAAFIKDGLGVAIMKDGQVVAGCTSFCCHEDGYEIQVDTHPDMRGRGYATAACAAFIFESLVRGKTPYWDAANAKSLRLARRLGYVFERAYTAWMLIVPEKATAEEAADKVIGV